VVPLVGTTHPAAGCIPAARHSGSIRPWPYLSANLTAGVTIHGLPVMSSIVCSTASTSGASSQIYEPHQVKSSQVKSSQVKSSASRMHAHATHTVRVRVCVRVCVCVRVRVCARVRVCVCVCVYKVCAHVRRPQRQSDEGAPSQVKSSQVRRAPIPWRCSGLQV
jgi:hypothetical protein